MNCLIVKTRDLAMNDLFSAAVESGLGSEAVNIDCETLDYDEKAVSFLVDYLDKYHADIVLSMNFAPSVSAACEKRAVPYAAYIYDLPLQSLYSKEAFNEVNHLFLFDKKEIELQRSRGLKNLHYLPLAANVSRMGKLSLTKKDEEDFSCNISFVGNQYADGRFAYYRERLNEKFRDELNNIAFSVIGRWDGHDYLKGSMSEELIGEMLKLSEESPEEKLGIPNRIYFEEVIIARAVAYTERRMMLERLSDMAPRWYGADAEEKDHIEGVNYYPRLYYEDTLPKAYNFSRINLSTCLHSISSGIPLRVFDIMGAGGFIMTNYQSEIEELFELGKEIVVYHSFEEMRELAQFFLRNEAARLNILLSGYKRVSREYNYREALLKIIEAVFE